MAGSTTMASYSHTAPPSQENNSTMTPVSQPQIQWSTITPSPAAVEKLRLLCHSQKELKNEGYVITPLDARQIEAKLRCMKCGKRASRKPIPKPVVLAATTANHEIQQPGPSKLCDVAVGGCGKSGHTTDTCWRLHPELKPRKRGGKNEHSVNLDSNSISTDDTAERAKGPSDAATTQAPAGTKTRRSNPCQYHIGRVRDKHFTCCNRHVSQQGCIEDEDHDLPAPDDPATLQNWHFHTTPPAAASSRSRSRSGARGSHVQAIALDCEMGTSRTSESELIRLTAVDFFTRAILIDNLVTPTVPMAHYNTRYSGVTAQAMRAAIRTRTAIHGRAAALRGLLEFVGPETVVVAHGGSSDFRALRWIHPCIVDTYILEGYAGPAGMAVPGGKSLQNLCRWKLGIQVQVRDRAKGKLGHDSLEDALATRELAIRWVESIPGGGG
ncbi:hypothetical protein G647_06858 [Cladophialophora carrionii CBS 160.54]|uniref:Exonuclease domain-containing protein n=1 Tax=Cladophialophora carrionii CBS 160.54 TaxID=1279043 RepID=V9D9Z9_9EURO|nr:uncharacterized protein G647_06858 [Cladophialophora carrionii CBS 160.54]ETI22782.1 hypothetical protein G647_06858 [Cladophialophora carrionii CBS 160.54]